MLLYYYYYYYLLLFLFCLGVYKILISLYNLLVRRYTQLFHYASSLPHAHTHHTQTSNILITDNFELKLADFGLARCLESSFMGRLFEGEGYSSGEGEFTNKVITLWYRPPELLLGETRYGCAVDIWSAGCIFAEIILGRPIFTGKTEMDQLKLIFDLIGTPTDRSWEGFRELKLIRTGEFSIEKARKPRLREKYGEKIKPSSALGLLEKLLELDPKKRCTASRALNHRYFQASPVAPDDPKELGKIDLGGDGSGYHEFKTKKRRREAKGVAKMAEDEAKRQGLSVEKQKEAFDVAYREHLQKGASEDKKKVEEEKQKQEKQHDKSKREQDQKGGRKDKPPQTEARDKQQQQQQSRPPPRNMMNQPPHTNMGNRPRDMPPFPRDSGNRDLPPPRDFNRDMPHPHHEMMMGRGPRDMPHPGEIGRGPPRDMPHPHDMGRGPPRDMPHPHDMGRGPRDMPHPFDMGRGGPPRDMGRGHPNNNDRVDQGGPWNNMNMGRGDGRRMPGRMDDNWGPPPPHLRDQRMHPDQHYRRDQFGPPNDQFGPPRRPNNGEGHYGPMGGGHPNDNPRRGPPDGNFFDDRGRGPNRNYNEQNQFNREEEFRSRRQQNDDVNERRREKSSERARDGSDANDPSRSSRGADRDRDDHPKNGDGRKDDDDERRRSRSPNRSERRRSRDSSRDKDRKRGHRRSHRDDDDRRHRQEKERKERKSERGDDDQDRRERKRSKESDRGGGSRKRHKRSRQDKDSRRRSDDRSRDRSERNDRRSDDRGDRDRPSFTPPPGRYDQYGNPIANNRGDRGEGRQDHRDESRDGRYGPVSGSQAMRHPMGRDGRHDDRYDDRRR